MSKWNTKSMDQYIEKLPKGYIEGVKEGMRKNADCHGCIFFIEEHQYCTTKKEVIEDLALVGVCERRLSK